MSPRKTHPENSEHHPGLVDKSSCKPHQTSAEVKATTKAIKTAKEAKIQAKNASNKHAADFESTALINKDFMDATPRPRFTPKNNMKVIMEADVSLVTSNIRMANTSDDKSSYDPCADFVTEDELVASDAYSQDTPMPCSRKSLNQ